MSATLCAVVFLHVALTPGRAFDAPSGRIVVVQSTDEAPPQAALKHPDGLLLAAAMQATARSKIRHATVPLPDQVRQPTATSPAWGHGAAFARSYAPPRLRRLFAPPSGDNPEA